MHVPACRAGEVGIVKAFPYSEGCIPAKVRRGLSLSISLSASLAFSRLALSAFSNNELYLRSLFALETPTLLTNPTTFYFYFYRCCCCCCCCCC